MPVGTEGLCKFIEGWIPGDEGAAPFVVQGDHFEHQLGSGLGEWHEAELVDDQQLVAGYPRSESDGVERTATEQSSIRPALRRENIPPQRWRTFALPLSPQ